METVSPYRPSSGPFGATFPQGKAIFRHAGSCPKLGGLHPLSHGLVARDSSPYTGEPTPRREFSGANRHKKSSLPGFRQGGKSSFDYRAALAFSTMAENAAAS